MNAHTDFEGLSRAARNMLADIHELAEALTEDEKQFLDNCAKEGATALRFSYDQWWRLHNEYRETRPWHVGMTAYRDALLQQMPQNRAPVCEHAAAARGYGPLAGRTF